MYNKSTENWGTFGGYFRRNYDLGDNSERFKNIK